MAVAQINLEILLKNLCEKGEYDEALIELKKEMKTRSSEKKGVISFTKEESDFLWFKVIMKLVNGPQHETAMEFCDLLFKDNRYIKENVNYVNYMGLTAAYNSDLSKKDCAIGWRYFLMAVENGSCEAHKHLGHMYETSVLADKMKSIYHYQQALQSNTKEPYVAEAAYALAQIYLGYSGNEAPCLGEGRCLGDHRSIPNLESTKKYLMMAKDFNPSFWKEEDDSTIQWCEEQLSKEYMLLAEKKRAEAEVFSKMAEQSQQPQSYKKEMPLPASPPKAESVNPLSQPSPAIPPQNATGGQPSKAEGGRNKFVFHPTPPSGPPKSSNPPQSEEWRKVSNSRGRGRGK